MKYLPLWNSNKFAIIKSKFRNITTFEQKNDNFIQLQKHSRKVMFSKHLSRSRIMELENITSITVLMNQVSWAKISLPSLKVLEWNCHSLPQNFQSDMEDFVILKMAHTIKEYLPVTDLHIMESFPFRWKHLSTDLMLRFMLIPLLADGVTSDSKIFFQRPHVVNILHDLLVGGERVSAKQVIEEKILKRIPVISDESDENLENVTVKSTQIPSLDEDQIYNFMQMDLGIQECLSVALLTAWSFADLIYFQNSESIKVLQKRMKTKLIINNKNVQ